MLKPVLVAALLGFAALQIALLVWSLKTYTLFEWAGEFFDPVSLLILADFAFFAAAVFLWMLRDAKPRGHRLWKWLPAYIVSPTAVLFLYLLLRKPEPRP